MISQYLWIGNPDPAWPSCILCLKPLEAEIQALAGLSSYLKALERNKLLNSPGLLVELSLLQL